MRNEYFQPQTLPAGLLARIISRITREQILQSMRRRLVAWFAVTVVAIAGLIPAMSFFHAELVASGWSQYFALIIATPGAAFAHWGDLLSSLSESIPVVGLTLVAAILVVVLWSGDKLVRFSRQLLTT